MAMVADAKSMSAPGESLAVVTRLTVAAFLTSFCRPSRPLPDGRPLSTKPLVVLPMTRVAVPLPLFVTLTELWFCAFR